MSARQAPIDAGDYILRRQQLSPTRTDCPKCSFVFRKPAHPNTAWLNHREMPDPVGSLTEPRSDCRTNVGCGGHRNSEKDNATPRRQAGPPCKPAKTPTEHHE